MQKTREIYLKESAPLNISTKLSLLDRTLSLIKKIATPFYTKGNALTLEYYQVILEDEIQRL